MGNANSLPPPEEEQDYWWNNATSSTTDPSPQFTESNDNTERTTRQRRMKKELDEFKLELARKHEKQRQLIAGRHKEMKELREEVQRLTEENKKLKVGAPNVCANEEIQKARRENLELKKEIAQMQRDLQNLNSEAVCFEQEKEDYKTHVVALKDVVNVSKQMLMIREAQLKELREKVHEIEASLAGKEFSVLSQDLRHEYEKQLQNIRNLRIYYEERQRADKREKDDLKRTLDETKKELEEERQKIKELTDNVSRLDEENSIKYDEIKNLESNNGLTKAECNQYQAELTVINQLFSQILLGFNNTQDIDIDKLIRHLEENHHILKNIAVNEESNQVSALPKVLLDLVNEVNDKRSQAKEENEEVDEESNINDSPTVLHQLNSASEIAENLPKVWKVLIELLSHQSSAVNTISLEELENENACYKVVETPKGPHMAPSVSKTYIRLKDLILEKKSLERETLRLKHLNTHLEGRLQDQEKRLELVSHELTETWLVVGKLQKKHQLLHTQEKILRYELAQKRKLLNELKEELEYSREKWQEAREKNSKTEQQWEQLRTEFAARKNGGGDDYNNSVESGYSDDKESSEDEPGYETDVSECNNQKLSVEGENVVVTADDHSDLTLVETENVEDVFEEKTLEERIKDTTSSPSTSEENTLEDRFVAEVTLQEELSLPMVDDTIESPDIPSTSHQDRFAETSDDTVPSASEGKTLEDRLSAREERLRRLEGQCGSLVQQVTNTSTRSVAISNKLDALHEIYGEGRSQEAEPTGSGSGDEASGRGLNEEEADDN